MRRQGIAAGIGLLGLVFVTACGSSPASPAGGSTAPPTSSPAVPAASASGQPAGLERLVTGPLSPGRYGTLAFEPPIAFELGDGWSALFADDSDEVALLHDSDVFLAFTRVNEVVHPTSGTAVPAPDDLIAWFEDHPQATTRDPTPVSVAGMDGRAVDVTPSGEIEIFAYPSGNMRMPPGRTHRFIVLPMEGPDLVIVIGSPSAGFDAALALAEPILDSLEVQRPG